MGFRGERDLSTSIQNLSKSNILFFFFPLLLRSKRPFRTKIYTFANKIGGGSGKIINDTLLSAIKEFATV